MKHLIGIGVLIAMAFGLRYWLLTSMALDISIHATYRVVPLRIVVFRCLMGTAVCLVRGFCVGIDSTPSLIFTATRAAKPIFANSIHLLKSLRIEEHDGT
jgi:hypothetical protein